MKKIGNLIEIDGAVYAVQNKEEIEHKLHSIEYSVLFIEDPFGDDPEAWDPQITPGKIYDISRVEYDDDGDLNWLTVWPNEDGLDENYYNLYDDSFVIVSQEDEERPAIIEFMIFNRLSEIDKLTKVLENSFTSYHQRELVKLIINGLKAQIELLERRLERVKWQKVGNYALTTVPYRESEKTLPAGSLVKIDWFYYQDDMYWWSCLPLDGQTTFMVNPFHLEPVGEGDQERIADYRKKQALILAERINDREREDACERDPDLSLFKEGQINRIELDIERWEYDSTLGIKVGPYLYEYFDADKNGMLSFLITLEQHVTSERVRKNIEKVKVEIQALQDHTEEDVARTN